MPTQALAEPGAPEGVPPVASATGASDAFSATPGVVVVRQGDTLGKLAAQYGVSVARLRELNPGLFDPGQDAHGPRRSEDGHWIYPGDRVRLRDEAPTSDTSNLAAKVKAAQAAQLRTEAKPHVEPQPAEATTPVASAEPTPSTVAGASPNPGTPPPAEATPPGGSEPGVPLSGSEAPVAVTSIEAGGTGSPETRAIAPPPAPLPPPAPPSAPHPARPVHVEAVLRTPYPRSVPSTPAPIAVANAQPVDRRAQLLMGGLLAGLSLFKMPSSMEASIGASGAADALSQYPLYNRNPAVVQYVADVGAKLIAQSQRTDLDWKFYVVESNSVNAFALPGGHVFVTTAALRSCRTEAELAGVLGHEISHVEKRHGEKKLQGAMMAQGIALAALGNQSNGVQLAGQAAMGLALKGYDRGQENEADARGVELAAAAGYDPHGLTEFLEILERQHPDQGAFESLLSDHPQTSDRIHRVEGHIQEQGLRGGASPEDERFRRLIASM